MNKVQAKKFVVILALGLIGWALCGAIMWVGMAVASMGTTLIVHAIGAPIVFGIISLVYFKAFNYTSPLQTAIVFVSVVVFMDVFLVALVIERSFEMFASLLGTWIPWALIFASTYLTGLYATSRAETKTVAWRGCPARAAGRCPASGPGTTVRRPQWIGSSGKHR